MGNIKIGDKVWIKGIYKTLLTCGIDGDHNILNEINTFHYVAYISERNNFRVIKLSNDFWFDLDDLSLTKTQPFIINHEYVENLLSMIYNDYNYKTNSEAEAILFFSYTDYFP